MAKRRQPTLAITQPHAKFLVSCRRLMSNALSQNFKKIAPSVQKLWPKNWRLALLYYRGGLFGLCLLDVLFGDILHVGNQGIWIFDNRIIGFQVTGGSHGEDPHCTFQKTLLLFTKRRGEMNHVKIFAAFLYLHLFRLVKYHS